MAEKLEGGLDAVLEEDIFDLRRFKADFIHRDDVMEAGRHLHKHCSRLDSSREDQNLVWFYGLLLDNPALNHNQELEFSLIEFNTYAEPKFVWSKNRGKPPSPIVRCVDVGNKLWHASTAILEDSYVWKGHQIAAYGQLSERAMDVHCIGYSDLSSWYSRMYSSGLTLGQIITK